ncbi:hypothetical protein MTP09_07440 [Chryseobacterium suipulveris]|uniref:Peptidase M56 domain-containing protein n=1 Tax=Chryseobacterium suipulveris TaxID=2929800 RepID=A0ABY4BLK1_9FLAO|nr:M56 family metallopeptidase [Chryseobacterium suipulveris]UOE39759.1 hypothetical protein MTP09_07440 [Chryseobacterium suipulveris]
METIFIYFGKVILCSGVMFLYYRLFLKDRTFHHYNRFYLLSVLVVSILIPLLKVNYFTLEVNSNIYLILNKLQSINSENSQNHDLLYLQHIALAFGLVAVFFLTKLIFGLIKIHRFKKQFPQENFEGIHFYQTNLEEAPFSFFRNLFWKNSIHLHSDLGRQILKHEMVHIEQKHSWDKILVEITTSLFWFNPFFYLVKKEINLVHEYLADKKAIKNSDTKAFAQMLLASHFSGKQLPATSPFLNSNLKKRLKMLKKSKTKYGYARKIFALPLLFAIGFVYLVNAKNREIKETNREIEKLVTELKVDQSNQIFTQDTISPKKFSEPQTINLDSANGKIGYVEEETGLHKDKIELYKENPDVFVDREKIRKEIDAKRKEIEPHREAMRLKETEAKKISEELRKKGEEFRELAKKKDFDNPKLKRLEKQMNELGSKIDGIFKSDEYQKNLKSLESKYSDLDRVYANADKYFFSQKEFEEMLKQTNTKVIHFDDLVNSPQFKEIIRNSEFTAKSAEQMAKLAEQASKDAEKLVNSKAFKQSIEDSKKAAELAAKNASLFGKSNIIILNGTGKSIATDDEIKIFLDGKPITKSEMNRFPSDKIERMEVNKKGFNGNANSEIRIYTRK